ncbi:MAG TPA: hypothetical protein VLJ88_15915 [Propionibacteriaceae bacterium]|nr:hypothetical protein [Propionibacteriaceae bacterium]
MSVLELDPNVVQPGWTPLIITVVLGLAVVALYFSMRKQFRKITIPVSETDQPDPAPVESPNPADVEPSTPAEVEPSKGSST